MITIMLIIEKLKNEIKKGSIYDLARNIWVSISFLYKLIWNKNSKYNPSILKKIYKFFNLELDVFFYKNLEKRNKKKATEIWILIRQKRYEKGFTLYELSLKTNVSAQTLKNIETKELNYFSWTLSDVLKFLWFSQKQMILIRQKIYLLYTKKA